MKTKLFITMALFAIIALAVIGCKHDEPEPVPPPNEVPAGGFKVTINNYELLSAEKFGFLKEVIPLILDGKTLTGNLTINVIADSSAAFSKISTKTLSVGANWFTSRDRSQIGSGLNSVADSWIE
jgi:hypothetical protein